MEKLEKWDETLAVGDLVTGFHKGIWKITQIERRYLTKDDLRHLVYANNKVGDEYSPLVHYTLVLTTKFKKARKLSNTCAASWCQKIDDSYIREMRSELERQITALEELRKSV